MRNTYWTDIPSPKKEASSYFKAFDHFMFITGVITLHWLLLPLAAINQKLKVKNWMFFVLKVNWNLKVQMLNVGGFVRNETINLQAYCQMIVPFDYCHFYMYSFLVP